MRIVPAATIVIASLITVFMIFSMTDELDETIVLAILWVLAPNLISLTVAVFGLYSGREMGPFPKLGATVCVLALIPYWDAYTYDGIDGQIGLIFVFVPIVQIIVLALAGGLGYITSKSIKDSA